MNEDVSDISVSVDDAVSFIIRCCREGQPVSGDGCELYIPELLSCYLREARPGEPFDQNSVKRFEPLLLPVFYAASWELCRRGVLRPAGGDSSTVGQKKPIGMERYMLTPAGFDWIRQSDQYDLLPLQPERLSRLLVELEERFGSGYQERAQEAIRCYSALAYLGCCAMCGAAAESITLSIAIRKRDGDEDAVLDMYSRRDGTRNVLNLILQGQDRGSRAEMEKYTDLLKYWRDIAAHGQLAGIGEGEAYLSLIQLYRFAIFADQRWERLVQA